MLVTVVFILIFIIYMYSAISIACDKCSIDIMTGLIIAAIAAFATHIFIRLYLNKHEDVKKSVAEIVGLLP